MSYHEKSDLLDPYLCCMVCEDFSNVMMRSSKAILFEVFALNFIARACAQTGTCLQHQYNPNALKELDPGCAGLPLIIRENWSARDPTTRVNITDNVNLHLCTVT